MEKKNRKKFKSNAQNKHNSNEITRRIEPMDRRAYKCKVKVKYKTYYRICMFVLLFIINMQTTKTNTSKEKKTANNTHTI